MSLKSLNKQAVDLDAGNEYWIQVQDGDSLGDSFFLVYGAQWLSGRVLDSRPKGRGSSLTGVTGLWSLSKTHLS